MEDFVKSLAKAARRLGDGPAGAATEATVMKLASLMEPGDTIIDGGNSYFKDDVRRSKKLKEKGITYVDVGTSGGVWGIDRGYCMMVGGPDDVGEAARSYSQDAGARHGHRRQDAGRGKQRRTHGGRRLSALRTGRRGTLCEDGPQRHRVWIDAGLCRRFRHHEVRQFAGSGRGASLHASTCRISPKCGAAAAWWEAGCWI